MIINLRFGLLKTLLKTRFCANLIIDTTNKIYKGAIAMKNPLESITGTIVSGLILTLVLVLFLNNFLTPVAA